MKQAAPALQRDNLHDGVVPNMRSLEQDHEQVADAQ
jgi:hypothetical protein